MAAALLRTEGLTLNAVHIYPGDPAALPLVAGLMTDPAAGTGEYPFEGMDWFQGLEFASRLGGDLLVLAEDGVTVAGGSYRRYDSTTAQLGWLWTQPDRRREGLARRVLAELESSAVWHGYQRIYAVAGPGRSEVRRLLASSGYRPLGSAVPESGYLGFVKAGD